MTDVLKTDVPDGLREITLWPGDPGYPQEVGGFNAAVSHRPELVVAARDAADVAAAVRYAADAGLPVGVQATGHGALTVQDGGLLISTRRMQRLVIDPAARTATVGAGVKWHAVIDAAAPHGLAGLCGSTSDVGVVGYTLGGGLPLLGRAFGFAADRVRRMTVVTADGRTRVVDAAHDGDLFAALRGGGGGFGVVTEMTFELLPLTEVYGGGLFFAGDDAPAVLRAYAVWQGDLPDRMCTSLAFLRLPPVPEIHEPLRGRFTMHLRVAHAGDPAEAERLLAPMRASAAPVFDTIGPLPCAQFDRVHLDPDHPVPYLQDGCLLPALDDASVAALLTHAGPESGCPLLLVEIRPLGGALAAPGDDCVGARGSGALVGVVGALLGPAAAAVPAAMSALHTALREHSGGRTFVSFHGAPGDATDRARAWPPDQYDRLQHVKIAHDPSDMFRFGHPIG